MGSWEGSALPSASAPDPQKTLEACGQLEELFIRYGGAGLVGCRRNGHRRTLCFDGQTTHKHTAGNLWMGFPPNPELVPSDPGGLA